MKLIKKRFVGYLTSSIVEDVKLFTKWRKHPLFKRLHVEIRVPLWKQKSGTTGRKFEVIIRELPPKKGKR